MIRLRELRKQQKMSMRDFGKLFGLAESTISLYETGKRHPDNESLVKFAKYYNVTVDYLLENEQKKEPVIEHDRLYNETLALFKKLPAEKKKQALNYLRFLVEHQGKQ
jgi:transcriptional regulator with XRE-family HTH domain